MIDPRMLVESTGGEATAPFWFWFVQFFKALGFSLHTAPMNLWYAGLLIALWLHLRGNPNARQFAGRLLRQMPVIVAAGVNLGIVPLLFIQLVYFSVFYPATILMAWYWIGIVVLLIPAYYGVYAYAWGIGSPGPSGEGSGVRVHSMARWRLAAGWLAAVFFLTIGFIFTNGLSLMEHVARWPELWSRHSYYGAAMGTALNTGDATFWPRWLLMFGLALGTTAVWAVFDAEWFAGKTAGEAYRRWAWGFARKLYTAGMIWAAAAGSWYVFGAWSDELRTTMLHGQWFVVALTFVTGAATGLPWLLLMLFGRHAANRPAAALVALSQFGVLALNAVSRQIVQNVTLKPYFDVSTQPIDEQWGPMAMFLIVFVIALIVLGWMIAQIVKCGSKNV
jgi:hypothetical protein